LRSIAQSQSGKKLPEREPCVARSKSSNLRMRARDSHGLRRFSHVSTVAVAGQRSNEVVQEDTAIDWSPLRLRSLCAHQEILRAHGSAIASRCHERFSSKYVLGDSRRAETNQFDMVRAFVFLRRAAGSSLSPDRSHRHRSGRFVADAVVMLHQKEKPKHEIYHLSSGEDAETSFS